MREIRKVDFQEFKKIYKQHLIDDFPRMERRPLFSIRNLYKKELYAAYTYEENGQLLAYAGLIYTAGRRCALLDYFAVVKEWRSTGLGSEFITLLRSSIDVDGMIIESENPELADTAKEQEIRKRRIDFYRRNGALDSETNWYAFGVHYCLLWLPGEHAPMPPELGRLTLNIYEQTMKPWLARKCLNYSDN